MGSKLLFVFMIVLINSIEWTSVRCDLFESILQPAPAEPVIISQGSSDEEQFVEPPSAFLGCGINSKSEGLVRSVDPSPNHDWPWIVMLLNRRELPPNFCGGVLINKNYVLTAAHCMKSKNVEDIFVRLGEYDLLVNFEARHIDVDVAEIKMHKDYSNTNYQHDIALLKLREPIEYTNTILPICLPTPNTQMQTNDTAIVAGWGAIFYGGISSDVLLEVSVPLWDYDACQSAYTQTIFDTNICAAGYEGQRDSCVGDSGGPLVVQQSNGRWTNIGIVSWGISCGIKNHPGIYTKVEAYLDWIRNNTQDAII